MAKLDIRLPDADERGVITKGLAWAARQSTRLDGRLMPSDVQGLYNYLMGQPEHGEAIVGTGIAFGELICRQQGYGWYSLKAEQGRRLFVGKSYGPDDRYVLCSPVKIVLDKAAAREQLQIEQLLVATVQAMEQEIADRLAGRV